MIGSWMWQRLYKNPGSAEVLSYLAASKDHPVFQSTDEQLREWGFIWLCPEPQKVLVRKPSIMVNYGG